MKAFTVSAANIQKRAFSLWSKWLGAGFIEEAACELGGRETKGLKFMGFEGMGNLFTDGGNYPSGWVVIANGTYSRGTN